MKKLLNIFLISVFAILSSSCIDSNLDLGDLEYYGDNEISLQGVYYRWITDEINPGTGEPLVKQVALTTTSQVLSEGARMLVDVQVNPAYFPAGFDVSQITLSNVVVAFHLSAGAVCRPVEGSAALGVPADWSHENHYIVTAGNGDEKEWTVELKMLPMP